MASSYGEFLRKAEQVMRGDVMHADRFPIFGKNNKEPRKQHKQTSGIRCSRERIILLSRLSNALWPRDDDEGKLFFLNFERKTKTKDEHGEEVKTHYNRKKPNSMCWICEQGERAPEP